MARNRKLKPGTVCVTVNTDHWVVNDGALVVVLRADFLVFPKTPYRIARVDGQPLGSVARAGGGNDYFTKLEAWCCRRKLKPVDDSTDPRDTTVSAGLIAAVVTP